LVEARRQRAGTCEAVAERARRATLTASRAPLADDQELAPGRNAFRIVTPGTAERAAFEKDRGADPRAVMHGVFLKVENKSGFHNSPHCIRATPAPRSGLPRDISPAERAAQQ